MCILTGDGWSESEGQVRLRFLETGLVLRVFPVDDGSKSALICTVGGYVGWEGPDEVLSTHIDDKDGAVIYSAVDEVSRVQARLQLWGVRTC